MAKGYVWPDDGRDWIDANEAGPLLGIGARYVPAWARHRGLEIWQPGGRYGRVMLLRKEVESLGELGKLHRRWKAKHDAFGGKRRSDKMPEAQAKAIFCDVREAAGILGVTTKAVHRLVAKGRVVPYQSAPRQRGSRLWFSRRTLELLREDPEWQKRRERGVNSSRGIASDRALAQAKWERGEWLDTEGAVGRKAYVQSHTESGVDVRWISGNEAAALMGVGMGRLNQWRRSGRLEGQKIGTKPGRGRWHYREFDIGEWMAKPDYQRARPGGKAGKRRGKRIKPRGTRGTRGRRGRRERERKWRSGGQQGTGNGSGVAIRAVGAGRGSDNDAGRGDVGRCCGSITRAGDHDPRLMCGALCCLIPNPSPLLECWRGCGSSLSKPLPTLPCIRGGSQVGCSPPYEGGSAFVFPFLTKEGVRGWLLKLDPWQQGRKEFSNVCRIRIWFIPGKAFFGTGSSCFTQANNLPGREYGRGSRNS